jgi:hypothetical protein
MENTVDLDVEEAGGQKNGAKSALTTTTLRSLDELGARGRCQQTSTITMNTCQRGAVSEMRDQSYHRLRCHRFRRNVEDG